MNISMKDSVRVLDSSAIKSIIRDVAKSSHEDAFYICDVGDIVQKYMVWKELMPKIEPFYAVKCNDSHIMLEILAALGTSFDCASQTEIHKILNLGVEASRIIYANPVKQIAHIKHARSVGVDLLTFDNESELHKIKQHFPNARLVIRIRSDDPNGFYHLSMKFGCDPHAEAPRLLRTAHDLKLNVVGVSFHIGGCTNPLTYRTAIATARELFDFGVKLGFDFNLLDIGGGYPGARNTSIKGIADVVNKAVEDFFPESNIRVIAEPGRYFANSAYTLACNIYSMRATKTKDAKKHNMYFITDGVFSSFNCVISYNEYIMPVPLKLDGDFEDAKLVECTVWGPTCDGADRVMKPVLLPELAVGDWLVFENMGAYTTVLGCGFNGFPPSQVLLVADESVWLLLKKLLPLSKDCYSFYNTPRSLHLRTIA